MNANKFIASVLIFIASGSVLAGDILPFTEADQFVSTRTRAEVQAEVRQAIHTGQLASGDVFTADKNGTAATQQPTSSVEHKEATDSAKNRHALTDLVIGG